RLDQDLLERSLIEVLECRDNRQAADEFGDQTILEQIFRLDLAEDFTLFAILGGHHLGAEADRGRPPSRRNDLFEPGKCAAAHEQNVSRVDLEEFLLRMLAAALRRNGGEG